MEDKYLLKIHDKLPITIEHGEGVYVYDKNGNKYLDFVAGMAVSSLGYGNKEFSDTLKNQIDKIIHSSNLYHNETCGKAARDLAKASGMNKIFFCNSGAEAVEGALKAARKYAYLKGNDKTKLIALKKSFHGRTMGALSITGCKQYRKPFKPLIPGIDFAENNNLDSVKKLISDKTCAIIIEPIQGEGGLYVADKEFLRGVRKLCDDNDILLIFDEIQCGMGRTGSMFYWQGIDVKPDILAMAKAIGNGLPVGAFGITEKIAKYPLMPKDHGTTYGGNPLACGAVSKVLEIFKRENITDNAKEVGVYLTKKLDVVVMEFECVKERRGLGLMQGLELNMPTKGIIDKALSEGLLITSAGDNVIRMLPPLIITKAHVDEMIDKLKKALR